MAATCRTFLSGSVRARRATSTGGTPGVRTVPLRVPADRLCLRQDQTEELPELLVRPFRAVVDHLHVDALPRRLEVSGGTRVVQPLHLRACGARPLRRD